MDRIALFSYQPIRSPIHDLDVRAKLFALCGLSVALLSSGPLGATALSLVVIVLFRLAHLSILGTLRSAWPFLLLAGFVLVSRSLRFTGSGGATTGGGSDGATELFSWLHVLPSGAADGALFVLHFLSLFLAAHLFVRTTTRGKIVKGVHWYLDFIPLIRAADVALMCALALSFVSVILQEAAEIRAAISLRLRTGTWRRRPILRMGALGRELLRRTILRSGELTQAVVVRGYRADAPRPSFAAAPRSWVAAMALVAAAFGAALL